jgi:hypothetical protein
VSSINGRILFADEKLISMEYLEKVEFSLLDFNGFYFSQYYYNLILAIRMASARHWLLSPIKGNERSPDRK